MKRYEQMVAEAMAQVRSLTMQEMARRVAEDRSTLIVDVRDETQLRTTGVIPGATHIPLGQLALRVEQGGLWWDPRLQDRGRPIVTVSSLGSQAARAAKLLEDLGFESVAYLEGGMQAW